MKPVARAGTVRVVGYVRVSKADKNKTDADQRASIRAQRDSIARYCKSHGWDLRETFEDFDITGAIEERTDYQRMREYLDSGEADMLVVPKLDRLSRDAEVLLGLLKPKRHPWGIVAVDQSIDTSTASGWLAAAMFAILAEHERLLISERTSTVLAQKKREGKHVGRPSGIPVEIEDRIATLHAEGMSATAIATLLEDEGVARPTAKSKSWHHSHVLAAIRRVEVRARATA